ITSARNAIVVSQWVTRTLAEWRFGSATPTSDTAELRGRGAPLAAIGTVAFMMRTPPRAFGGFYIFTIPEAMVSLGRSWHEFHANTEREARVVVMPAADGIDSVPVITMNIGIPIICESICSSSTTIRAAALPR